MIGRSATSVWSVLLAGLAGLAFVCGAAAGQYNCEVPVAVLCQGCATDVSIALQSRGGCRVSFTPASTAAASQLTGAVSFRIWTPNASSVAAFRHKVAYRGRVASSRSSPKESCFSFNGQQYCE
jgi:hypothetical protein